MEDHLLGVGRLMRHHAGAADFRAGSGGGRHRDDRRDRVGVGARPPVADILEIPDRPRLPGLEGDQLAEVERRAAAECDDAVMLALPEHLDAGGQVRFHRVGPDVGEDAVGSGIVEQLQRLGTTGSFASPGSVTNSGRLMPAAATHRAIRRSGPRRSARWWGNSIWKSLVIEEIQCKKV